MDIKLIPVVKKGQKGARKFTFPALPEQIKGKSAAKYQSFDIISKGTVKLPKGTEPREISWEGEFFGESKRKEAVVRKNAWKKPSECVEILNSYLQKGTVLNLIVTETWINLDVTVASFQLTSYGAYGNIKYSISFIEKKTLKLYDTSELKIESFQPRIEPEPEPAGHPYEVRQGDSLWKIAGKELGDSLRWPEIYDANAGIIESTAQAYGKPSSDHGHWIYPGTNLTIPA